MKRTPQQFENDYFPGWAVSKKHASPEMLERLERFIAEKRAPSPVKWWRSPDLRQRHVVVVPPQQN